MKGGVNVQQVEASPCRRWIWTCRRGCWGWEGWRPGFVQSSKLPNHVECLGNKSTNLVLHRAAISDVPYNRVHYGILRSNPTSTDSANMNLPRRLWGRYQFHVDFNSQKAHLGIQRLVLGLRNLSIALGTGRICFWVASGCSPLPDDTTWWRTIALSRCTAGFGRHIDGTPWEGEEADEGNTIACACCLCEVVKSTIRYPAAT